MCRGVGQCRVGLGIIMCVCRGGRRTMKKGVVRIVFNVLDICMRFGQIIVYT